MNKKKVKSTVQYLLRLRAGPVKYLMFVNGAKRIYTREAEFAKRFKTIEAAAVASCEEEKAEALECPVF